MTAKPFCVTSSDYARPLNIVGEQITILASGEQTEGYEIFLQRADGVSGPPAHAHPWDESFFVIRGEIEFGIGDDAMVAKPGALVHLPAGTVHWFRFGAGGGEMISMTSRLGASKMFTDFDREISPQSPDLAKLVEIGARHGLEVPT